YPSLKHLRDSLISRLLDEFSPFPMIVALAWAASLLRTIEWSLILTAVYLLVLPVPHRKVKGYFKAHDLMGEVVGDALRTLKQREQVGSWAEVLGGSLRRRWDRSVSPTLEGLASAGPVAASILAAVEAYDNTRTMLGSLPRPISREDIERECIILTGTNPDPSVVPVLLSVVEKAKRPLL